MRVLFMGSAPFSMPTLMALVQKGYDVVGVVTAPDRPRGRGHRVVATEVAQYAGEKNIPVFKPTTLKRASFVNEMVALAPDVIVLVAYGQMVPPALLQLPPLGPVNLHPSLLPLYRGAAPLHHPLLAGDTVTGVTTMFMTEKLDAGDLLLQRPVPIEPDMTVGELHDRLADIGADLVVDTLARLAQGGVSLVPQDHARATYADKVFATAIDWNDGGVGITRIVRGMTPFPGAYTWLNGRRVKIHGARVWDGASPSQKWDDARPGTVVAVDEAGIVVQTGSDDFVAITHIQPESRRPMAALDFARGYDVNVGLVFSSEDPDDSKYVDD